MVSEGKKGGRRSRSRPDLVVPSEERAQEQEGGGALASRRESVDVSSDEAPRLAKGKDEARAVGDVLAGRRRYSYTDSSVSTHVKLDSAVHFALRVLIFETGMDQQYLVNLAVREFCREHGVDPEAVREGKGYMVSFPGGIGEGG